MTTILADAFTASNGTAISGRTPDTTVSSRTWATGNFAATSPAGTIDIQSNAARITATDDGFAINCGQTDYTVTWYTTLPASGQYRGGCRFRIQNAFPFTGAADRDYYFCTIRYDLGTGNIRMTKMVNGVETVLGSDVTMSFTYGQTYKMTLTVSGTTYTLYVDDVSKKTLTDSTYTGGTWIGFGAGGLSGNDFKFDSISVDIAGVTVRRTDSDRTGSRS